MPKVVIRIYQQSGDASPSERKIIRTIFLDTISTKRLTAKRAGQLLANHFPEFRDARKGMTQSDEGWVAMRSLHPLANCPYQYLWEYAIVTQEENQKDND